MPVRKGFLPVSKEARVGEHVGCERALRKSTPLFFKAVMFGMGGTDAPTEAVRGKLSMPKSSAMIRRILLGCACVDDDNTSSTSAGRSRGEKRHGAIMHKRT